MVVAACACASAVEAGMVAAGDAIRIQTPPAGAVSSSSPPLPVLGAQRLSSHARAARFGKIVPSPSPRIAALCNSKKADWVSGTNGTNGTKSSTFRSLVLGAPMLSSWDRKGYNCYGVPCPRTVISSAVSTPAMSDTQFVFPSAPMELPEGPWKEVEGGVNAPKGFRAAGMYAGLRAVGEKPDLALVVCDTDAVVAGVFTLNLVAAAPVQYCRQVLKRTNVAKAVLINAGQANAGTGEEGQRSVLESCAAAAEVLGVAVDSVLVESTGVIGQQIKKTELIRALPKLASLLSSSAAAAESAAIAITTTDLVSKSVAIETEIGGTMVRVGGMAKGSGMIHPNMATLLSVVTCDAAVTAEVWRSLVLTAVRRSFNQITVDGDTSTNDSVIALASGAAGGSVIGSVNSKEAQQLQTALDAVCQGLAKSIASDGEGATLLLEVSVSGAPDDASAATVARSVTASSLVKSAVYGRDPNWGRLACAAGYAGIAFDPNDLKISLGTFLLMEAGQPQNFDRAGASAYLKEKGDCHGTVHINISIGSGPGQSKAWGCDLSYDYVKINAEYTT